MSDLVVRMRNDQTGEGGQLSIEPEESRFNFMIIVGEEGRSGYAECGYWEPHEWERDGWKVAQKL